MVRVFHPGRRPQGRKGRVARVTFDGNTSSVDLLLRDAAGSIDTMVLATGGVVTKKYEPFGA